MLTRKKYIFPNEKSQHLIAADVMSSTPKDLMISKTVSSAPKKLSISGTDSKS